MTQPTEDLDAVYTALMAFSAGGGGDTPEHVNAALDQAYNNVQWSQDARLKLVYLVGDAPPHRDYDQHIDFARIVPGARQSGILTNVVQCGQHGPTTRDFRAIASLGGGEFFQIDQGGGMTAVRTPYDEELLQLQQALEGTKLSFGSRAERARDMRAREAVMDMDGEAGAARASAMSKAAPSAEGGRADRDVVGALEKGELAELEDEALPEELQGLAANERKARVEELASRRQQIETKLKQLVSKRDAHLKKTGKRDGFDGKVLESLKEQARSAGIGY